MAKKSGLTVVNRQIEELREKLKWAKRAIDYSANLREMEKEAAKAEVNAARDALFAVTKPLYEAVDAMLASVNGRATTHTIDRALQVAEYAERAEKQMEEAGIPQVERVGAILIAAPPGPSANAYKYQAISTMITLRRFAGKEWRLMTAERVTLKPRQAETFGLSITRAAADSVVRKALGPFYILAKTMTES